MSLFRNDCFICIEEEYSGSLFKSFVWKVSPDVILKVMRKKYLSCHMLKVYWKEHIKLISFKERKGEIIFFICSILFKNVRFSKMWKHLILIFLRVRHLFIFFEMGKNHISYYEIEHINQISLYRDFEIIWEKLNNLLQTLIFYNFNAFMTTYWIHPTGTPLSNCIVNIWD